MIKCNHCGKMTPAGAVCQSCGAPLAIRVDDGLSPRTSAQEQPELPAWLESLRAGERSAPATNSSSNFSTADFIEEGALPSWMRAERNDNRENTASHAPVPAYPPAFSDQNNGSGTYPPAGLAAQSLIDEKSLPSWMQEGGKPSIPPSSPGNLSAPSWMQEGGKPSIPPSSPGNLSASSLVQQDNVPDWMKSLQQPGESAPAPAPSFRPEQSARPAAMGDQPADLAGSPSPSPLASGFSAHDLIDQQSLPSWMQSDKGRNGGNVSSFGSERTAQAAPANPAAGAGQLGFSASSLLDVNALPQWLREGGQPASANPTARPGVSNANWPAASSSQSPTPTSPAGSTPQQEGGPLSASSFIDADSLPSWLRSDSDQYQQGMAGGQRPASSIPPRADNIRVPSRPRGEVNPTESSELAANVFASMLGVASAAPNYPASQQPAANYPGAQQPSANTANTAQPYQQQQAPNANYPQAGQLNQASQPATPYGQISQTGQLGQAAAPQVNPTNIPNMGSVPNSPSQMGGMYSQGQGYGYGVNSGTNGSMSGIYGGNYAGNNPGQGNPSMGGSSSLNGISQYPGNAGSMGTPSPQSQIPDTIEDQKNNKKRGVFEAIRDWLSR